MFQWAQAQLDKISQTVAPPPTDGPGRFAYCVQRNDEDGAMGCVAEIDPVHTVINQAKGLYPIHMACQYSCERLIGLLMNQPGIDIETYDLSGNTPLHHASMSTASNSLDVVKLLIQEYGASALAKNLQGQTPYDVATMNSIRQYLLPIQLQAETKIALDNGGQGLPPGIDLGGLRISNHGMPPPPTGFGSSEGEAPPPVPPSSHMFDTPHPAEHERIASAPAASSLPPAPTSGPHEYSRVGASSAALKSASKYRADGFHSSSSDVGLQKKYGHASGVQRYVPPPPSSGNSSSLPPPAPGSGGVNPFAAGAAVSRYGGLPSRRYVAYGPTAGTVTPAPVSGPVYSQYSQASPIPSNLTMFTPGSSTSSNQQTTPASAGARFAPAAPSPYGVSAQQQQPQLQPHYVAGSYDQQQQQSSYISPEQPQQQAQSTGTDTQQVEQQHDAPSSSAGMPSSPYLPQPPYQYHNYTTPQRPDFVSPAAATQGSTPGSLNSPLSVLNSGSVAEANANDIFSAPSPQKGAELAPASISSATEIFGAPAALQAFASTPPTQQTTATALVGPASTSASEAFASPPPAHLAVPTPSTSGPFGVQAEHSASEAFASTPPTLQTTTAVIGGPASTSAYEAFASSPPAHLTVPTPSTPGPFEVQAEPSASEAFASQPPTQQQQWNQQNKLGTIVQTAHDYPPVGTALSTASNVFGVAESSAENVFGAAPHHGSQAAHQPTAQFMPTQNACASNEVATGRALYTTITPEPISRARSAEELFAENPPREVQQSASEPFDNPQPNLATSTAGDAASLFGSAGSGSAEQLFGTASQSAAGQNASEGDGHQQQQHQEESTVQGDLDDDGQLDDIPLSPQISRPLAQSMAVQATSLEAATNAADSLFATIGMPPPPFSSRKR